MLATQVIKAADSRCLKSLQHWTPAAAKVTATAVEQQGTAWCRRSCHSCAGFVGSGFDPLWARGFCRAWHRDVLILLATPASQ